MEAAAEAEYAKVEEVLEVGEESEDDFVTDEERSAVRKTCAELEAQQQERASLAERKRQMKEKKKSKAGVKDARAPLKRRYCIPKRPLDAVHREVIVAQVVRDAEATKMRTQWNSLTAGKPKAALPGRRRVQFRL